MPALGFLLSGRYCSLRLEASEDEGSSNRHDRNRSGAFVLDIVDQSINRSNDESNINLVQCTLYIRKLTPFGLMMMTTVT